MQPRPEVEGWLTSSVEPFGQVGWEKLRDAAQRGFGTAKRAAPCVIGSLSAPKGTAQRKRLCVR